jgi:TetR/AcrR family transcriptional regulator, cholesterol catabolism regulator
MVPRPGSARLRPVRQEKPVMADRRERILAAAAKRFADHGFGATTVRQIAEDVKVLSGSLYHHFATKEEMLDAIVRGPVLRLQDLARDIAEGPGDAEARLAAMIRLHLGEYAADVTGHAILFHERKFFRRSPDFIFVAEAKKETYAAWVRIFDDGVDAGLFRSDIDRFLTISTVMRMLNAAADWHAHEDGSPRDAPTALTLDELFAFYLDFVLRAVRTPDRAGLAIPGGF